VDCEIKISALAGDVIPIGLVAHAMAMRDATADGPDYLQATLDGSMTRYTAIATSVMVC